MTIDRGTVVLVELDPTVGHEQRGVRPCIAVSDPSVNADQRFPLIAVVPVTGCGWCGRALSCPVTGDERPQEGILRPRRSSPISRQAAHPPHLWTGVVERARRHRPGPRAVSRPPRRVVAEITAVISFRARHSRDLDPLDVHSEWASERVWERLSLGQRLTLWKFDTTIWPVM